MVEEVTQLDVGLWADIAELSTAAGGAGRLRRGPGAADEGVPAAARPGMQFLRVPLRDAVQVPGRGLPDACLVISHAHRMAINDRDDGQSFTPAELLRSTRLCHAITYASCQGLTLRGRVWLCDTLNPHFS